MALSDLIRRRMLIGASVISMLAVAGAATTLATQGAFAQSSPTPSATAQATPGTGTSGTNGSNGTTHQSNEDPAHEAQESPEREAAEDNGTAFMGGGPGGHGHGSNEDPAHEAQESPEREAQEDAQPNQNQNPATPSTTTPSSSTAQ